MAAQRPPRPCTEDEYKTLPRCLLEEARDYYYHFLKGQRKKASSIKRRLVRKIRRNMESPSSESAAGWLLLADLFVQKKTRSGALARALELAPRNPEVHAELASLSAESEDRDAVKHHGKKALRYCRGFDIEETILWTVYDAARSVALQELAQKALRVGKQRFPESVFFDE